MERGDYLGAYNAFRRAYGYDPANELARSMTERAFRLQTGKGEKEDAERPAAKPQTAARLQPTAYESNRRADDSIMVGRNEQLQSIQYETTGLTLEFTPQVFPNLDVQVKMSIKSNDVTRTAGARFSSR